MKIQCSVFKKVHTPPPRGGVACAYKRYNNVHIKSLKTPLTKRFSISFVCTQKNSPCTHNVPTNSKKPNDFNNPEIAKEAL